MNSNYKPGWKRSSQKRKQVKYRANAPKHQSGKFLNAPLSEDLREEHSTKSARVRTGDTVEVLRGDYKQESGEVERVDTDKAKLYIRGVERVGKGGQKQPVPVAASNVRITKLVSDERRFKN